MILCACLQAVLCCAVLVCALLCMALVWSVGCWVKQRNLQRDKRIQLSADGSCLACYWAMLLLLTGR